MMDVLPERISERIETVTESGCWLWGGDCCKKEGYGRLSFNGRKQLAHRVVYSLIVGQIPGGLQLDHLCRVRCCVNPSHLEPVTSRENILRGVGIASLHAKKTHCPKGHLLPERDPNKRQRICHACESMRPRKSTAEWRRNNREHIREYLRNWRAKRKGDRP